MSLFFFLGCSVTGCSDAERAAEPAPVVQHSLALIEEGLASELSANESVPIIVNLRAAAGAEAIAAAQDALLSKSIVGFALGRRYRHVPALAGRATAQAVQTLSADPGVSYVQRDHPGGGQLKEAVPAIGGDQARTQFGVTGKGVRVAVLDTGIDTDHPDLRDALIAQHCFTQFACPPLGSEGTSAEDDHGHGTNVAGIIASDGMVSSRGFAPAVELIAVKINNANDSGQESDWVAGMDWLYDNLSTQKVRLVNLSIGTTALYTGGEAQCDRAHPAMAAAIKNLVAAGVTVFAATGNRGSSTSMAAPACNSNVIAVGAVYDSTAGRQPPLNVGTTYSARWGAGFASCNDASSALDQIACFTNSTARMDLVAPGAPIISDSLRGRTEEYWGTSQASPAAVGVAALMLECNPELTPAEIKRTLTETGVMVKDTRNGLSFPSLRALSAVRAVCSEGEPMVPGDAGAGQVNDASVAEAGLAEAGTLGSPPDAGSARDAATGPLPSGAPIQTPSVPGLDASTQLMGGTPAGDATVSVYSANADCDCSLARSHGRSSTRELASLLALFGLALRLARRRQAA